VHVVIDVFGAFTRALWGADLLDKREEYLRRHPVAPGRQRQGIVPDLQIGTLYELKGMRSDRSHSNYNGTQVTGVEKRGIKIPMEIQKQASGLWIWTRSCSGWLHRRWGRGSGSSTSWAAGVKPLAFGQYEELGPGFEQLLDQLAEEGADEAANQAAPAHPQPRSSEGSTAPAAAAAGGGW
jgi:hypothetical protein